MRGGTGALSDQDSIEMHKSCQYQNNKEFKERERGQYISVHIYTHTRHNNTCAYNNNNKADLM